MGLPVSCSRLLLRQQGTVLPGIVQALSLNSLTTVSRHPECAAFKGGRLSVSPYLFSQCLRQCTSSTSASSGCGNTEAAKQKSNPDSTQSTDSHNYAGASSSHTSSCSSSSSEGSSLRQQLLDAALEQVPIHGWTHGALVAGARQLGLSPSVTGVLGLKREAALVQHFVRACNAKLSAELASRQEEFAGMRVTQRVAAGVKARLLMLAPFMDTWPQALAVLSRPENVAESLQLLHEIVDEIWVAAGDNATDANWYTKRILLAGVYSSTELYMLTDFSPEYSDTWQALERRLQDALLLGKAARDAKGSFSAIAQALTAVALNAQARQAAAAASAASAGTPPPPPPGH